MSSVYRILKVWTIDPQTIDNWTTVLKGYGGNIKLLLQTKRAFQTHFTWKQLEKW